MPGSAGPFMHSWNPGVVTSTEVMHGIFEGNPTAIVLVSLALLVVGAVCFVAGFRMLLSALAEECQG